MISLATSLINEKVRKNVNACLDENRIGQGRFNKEFEEKAAKYFGIPAVCVTNGTMADMVAVACCAELVKDPTRIEVIVPALTFVAQTNSVLMNGLTPVFVDVTRDYQMDVQAVRKVIGPKTLAIFAVHLLGRQTPIDELRALADEFGVMLIEDCCEAYGGETSDGRKFGTIGDFGTFSFFPSHTITTGEGGMVISREHSDLVRKVMNHGRRGDSILDKFHFDVFGFNGKMSNILASIGAAVIGTADSVILKRRANVALYNEKLGTGWYASSPHCFPVAFKTQKDRDAMLGRLLEAQIEARKLFSCLPTQEAVYAFMGQQEGLYPVAEEIGRTHLFVPVHQDLSQADIEKVCAVLAG